jgi:demethylmenaquinone methyltransferase/2-methoxy-6-polyprenyl-1,4-benzoquinol methylase
MAVEEIKPYGQNGSKHEQVEAMFDNIAPTYDGLNHTLSLGVDRLW